MKFIFPQNYNFNNKLLGVIDYSTAILNIVWIFFVFFILNLVCNSISIKLFVGIILCVPLLLLSIVGFNGENIFYVFSYMFKFIFKQKIFLYNKK